MGYGDSLTETRATLALTGNNGLQHAITIGLVEHAVLTDRLDKFAKHIGGAMGRGCGTWSRWGI